MIRAGELRHKIVIQQNTPTTRDSMNVEVDSWADFATVWASIEPIRGKEFWDSQQVNAEITGKIKIRYLAGVISKMRVKYETRIFEIISVINPGEKNSELQLMVKESV